MARPLLCLALLLCLLPACGKSPPSGSAANPASSAQPSPTLTSEDVVRHQLTALQHNDTPAPDTGIAIAFRFASPENKVFTGPVERFTQMVHQPGYAPLLGCQSFTIADLPADDLTPPPHAGPEEERSDDEGSGDSNNGPPSAVPPPPSASDLRRHLVRILAADGSEWFYLFLVRKQTEGPYTDCWMTDAVMPIAPPPPPPEAPPPEVPPPTSPPPPTEGSPNRGLPV